MNRTKNFSRAFIALVIISLVSTVSCKKNSSEPTPGPNQVFMENIAFKPPTLTVTKGTTVTWVNHDNVAHTVNSTTNLFASPGSGINPGSSFQFTFTQSGTYQYQCLIHPNMMGTVVVQ